VDFARRSYRTRVRPFFDSDEEVTFQWYRAADDAPKLGPAAIISLDWLANGYDDRQKVLDVGEVPGTSRDYFQFRTPIGLDYEHVCGTPEVFADGASFDPDQDTQYDEQGLPLCCGGPALPEFEMEIDFDATVSAVEGLEADPVCNTAPTWTATVFDAEQIITVPPGLSFVHFIGDPPAFYRIVFVSSTEPTTSAELFSGGCLLSFLQEGLDPGDTSFSFYVPAPSGTTYLWRFDNTEAVPAVVVMKVIPW